MYRIASLTAYDVMSQVHIHVGVREYSEVPGEPSSIVFECTTTIPGIGETDPRLWAKDALIGMLEAM